MSALFEGHYRGQDHFYRGFDLAENRKAVSPICDDTEEHPRDIVAHSFPTGRKCPTCRSIAGKAA